MIVIDLAFDDQLAKELAEYLTIMKIDNKLKGSKIQIYTTNLDEKILAVFLEKTKRERHIIQKIYVDSYLISKLSTVEDLGLATCEICGLVATRDKLFSHRWTHGA